MKLLDEIKSVIYETDCTDCVPEGWSRSQPILTKDENGELIDNYFMYGSNFTRTVFSTPIVVFGIYSDAKKTAYKTWMPQSERKEIALDGEQVSREEANKAYARYEEVYPMVRACAYSECNVEQKQAVKDYVASLKVFAGPVVWKFYQELFPSFFEWAQSL